MELHYKGILSNGRPRKVNQFSTDSELKSLNTVFVFSLFDLLLGEIHFVARSIMVPRGAAASSMSTANIPLALARKDRLAPLLVATKRIQDAFVHQAVIPQVIVVVR